MPPAVLLLEDNLADAVLARRALIDVGLPEVTTCGSVEEAVAIGRSGTFDVAILDLHVEDSAGLETVRHFRVRNPDMPVIVLAGSVTVHQKIELVRLGVDFILDKDQASEAELASAVLSAYLRVAPRDPRSDAAAQLLLKAWAA